MPRMSRMLAWPVAAAGFAIAAAASAADDADITVTPESEDQGATVARAVITSGVVDREPRDHLSEVTTDTRRVFFFTEIRNGKGLKVTHRWLHEGRELAAVDFAIEGDRWRVWSSKQLRPDWTGDWAVEVVTDDGRVLGGTGFEYVAAGDEPSDTPGADTPEENPLGPGESPEDGGQSGELRIPGDE